MLMVLMMYMMRVSSVLKDYFVRESHTSWTQVKGCAGWKPVKESGLWTLKEKLI